MFVFVLRYSSWLLVPLLQRRMCGTQQPEDFCFRELRIKEPGNIHFSRQEKEGLPSKGIILLNMSTCLLFSVFLCCTFLAVDSLDEPFSQLINKPPQLYV